MNNDLEQFSEERLKELESLGLNARLDLKPSEGISLIRIALAAKQAKPIGWMDTCELFDLQHGYTSKILPKKEMNNDIPLYTTTPPPHTEHGNQVEVHQFIINNPEKDGYIEWADCNKDYFDSISIDHRRVLYTTPQPAHTEQDGWKLVPIEPTEAMKKAYYDSSLAPISKLSVTGYRALIAAAPKPESE